MAKTPWAHVPLIANGNIREWSDVVENLKLTRADGVMSAEGILDDPALFFDHVSERARVQEQLSACSELGRDSDGGGSDKDTLRYLLDRLPSSNVDLEGQTKPDRVSLALEYLDLAQKYPVKMRQVRCPSGFSTIPRSPL